jgi:YD repeat-containing protein
VIRLTYDAQGRPVSVGDPAGQTTVLGFDLIDLTSLTLPSNQTWRRFTDAAGRLIAITNPSGRSTFYEVDALRRVTAVRDAGGAATTITYDGNGNVVTLTDAPRRRPDVYVRQHGSSEHGGRSVAPSRIHR